MNLSPNFTLRELTSSRYAHQHGIKEQFHPPQSIINALKALATNTLQPLRDKLGMPIAVNSGYRCPEVNRGVGGSRTSFHLRGMAADIRLIGGSNAKLFRAILEHDIPFTELIWEYGSSHAPSWVHVAYNPRSSSRSIKRAYSGPRYKRLTDAEARALVGL